MLMRKDWKNKRAVSPVIATILMVAITVVLAAVLYVMVMGMGGSGNATAPTVSLAKSGTDKVIVTIDSATDMTAFKFSYGAGTTVAIDSTTGSGNDSATMKFVDAGADGKVTTGDYFLLSGDGTTHYAGELTIYWVNGDTTQALKSISI